MQRKATKMVEKGESQVKFTYDYIIYASKVLQRLYDSRIYKQQRTSVAQEVKTLFSKFEVPRVRSHLWYCTRLRSGSTADPLQLKVAP